MDANDLRKHKFSMASVTEFRFLFRSRQSATASIRKSHERSFRLMKRMAAFSLLENR